MVNENVNTNVIEEPKSDVKDAQIECVEQPKEEIGMINYTKLRSMICVGFTAASVVVAGAALLLARSISAQNDLLSDKIDLLQKDLNSTRVELSSVSSKLNALSDDKQPINLNITVNKDGSFSVEDAPIENVTPNTPQEEFDTTPFLGVAFNQDDVEHPLGVKVGSVIESTPAFIAGIKAGDIIMAVNGVNISTIDDLTHVLSACTVEDIFIINLASIEDGNIVMKNVQTQLTYRGNFDLGDN